MMLMTGIGLNADWVDGDDSHLYDCLVKANVGDANCCELIMHSMDVLLHGRLLPQRVRDVKSVLGKFDFLYTIHMPYGFDPSKGDSAFNLTFFKSCLDFAHEIQARNITVHASAIAQGDAASLLRDRDFYREAAGYAGGITIGIENPCYADASALIGAHPDALVAHIANIGRPNVGITLDFGHAFLSSRTFARDYLADVRTLAPHAAHYHVHDNFGIPGNVTHYMDNFSRGVGDLHLPPGWGEIPWSDVWPEITRRHCVFIHETEFRLYPYFASALRFTQSALCSE